MKKNWRNLVGLAPKPLLLTGALVLASQCLGQGQVNFVNYIAGAVNAPIYDVDCKTPLAGGGQFLVQLYEGPLGSTSLAPVGSAIPIKVQGYFDGGTLAIPGVAPESTVEVQVRAWRVSDGKTFEQADHPGGHVGESDQFEVLASGTGLPSQYPTPLVGLQSFCLTEVIPEPPVWSLGLLGSFVLALRHRRRPKAVGRMSRP